MNDKNQRKKFYFSIGILAIAGLIIFTYLQYNRSPQPALPSQVSESQPSISAEKHTQSFDLDPSSAPFIENADWGYLEINHGNKVEIRQDTPTKKADVIIWPGGYESWNWKQFDMHHNPGINSESVDYLLRKNLTVTTIILTKGYNNYLKNNDLLIKNYAEKGYKVESLNTKEAIQVYNDKVNKGEKVSMLLHLTC